jgi:hypothetical protein
MTVLPPPPSDVTWVTGVGGIATTALPPLLAGLIGTTLNTQVSEGVRVLLGLFAFGLLPPHSVTITGATLTPGAGTLDLTLTGTGSYNWMFIIPLTTTFTYTATLSVAPSADPWNPHRIVRVTTSGGRFTFGRPLPSFLSSAIGGVVSGEVEPRIENVVNDALTAEVTSALADAQSVRTATGVISAFDIVITSSGIRFQISIADFRLPVVPMPSLRTLAITIVPDPVERRSVHYTIHVAALGLPVENATVTLTNYQGARAVQTSLPATDVHGNTPFTDTLRSYHHDATSHGGGVVDRYPRLSVSAPGAYPATLELTREP